MIPRSPLASGTPPAALGSANIDNADVACDGNLEWDAGHWGRNWN